MNTDNLLAKAAIPAAILILFTTMIDPHFSLALSVLFLIVLLYIVFVYNRS